MYKLFLHSLLLLLINIATSQAFNKPIKTNYFASLRSNKANVRAGPGIQYPIKFTFELRGLPIKIISEYDNWNEIIDYEGDTGWINQNLITKKREIIIRTSKSFINLHSKPTTKSKIILRLENNVIGSLIKCIEKWCGIKIDNKKGWVQKKEIWGVK